MFLTTAEAAKQLGLSQRHIRRAVAGGKMPSEKYGRAYVIPARQIQVMQRTEHKGRAWLPNTQEAALDLLSSGHTNQLSGSQNSRLRRRLKTLSIQALVNQILRGRAELRSATTSTDSDARSLSIVRELGLSAQGGLGVLVAKNARVEARRQRLVVDGDGDVAVVEGLQHHRAILEAMALFAFGNAREHAAAARWLTDKQVEL